MSEVSALGDEGAAVDEGISTENNPGEPTTSVEVFDPTPYNDHMVTLKVDGEDVQMSLNEALAGSMRQADYTKKTQSLAEVREAATFAANLRAALLDNPEQTLLALANAWEINLVAGQTPDPEELDPVVAELNAVKAQVAAMTQKDMAVQVQQEIDELKQRYPDFDRDEIIPFALERKISLEEAYQIKAFRTILAKQASDQVAADEAAAKAAVTEQKRTANAVVAPGHSPRPGSEPAQFASFKEAAEAALRQHGL